MTSPMNPFDAADLSDFDEAQHLVAWYTRLSETMRQRCIDTIQDDAAMLEFLRNATAHAKHMPEDFDSDVIHDMTRRMLEKLRR